MSHISQFDTLGQAEDKGALIIKAGPFPMSPMDMCVTFNSFAHSTRPSVIGSVQDKKQFSQPMALDSEDGVVNLYIKAKGTDFIIPSEYKQFLPAVERVIEEYKDKYGVDGACLMAVVQKTTLPNEEDKRDFTQAHRDITLDHLLESGSVSNGHYFIVSDNLPTGFSNEELEQQDMEAIKNAKEPYKTMCEILDARSVSYKTFKPYDITHFDSTSTHAIANPKVPTLRTALVLAFIGPDEEIGPINNPWLEKVLEEELDSTQEGANKAQNNVNNIS